MRSIFLGIIGMIAISVATGFTMTSMNASSGETYSSSSTRL